MDVCLKLSISEATIVRDALRTFAQNQALMCEQHNPPAHVADISKSLETTCNNIAQRTTDALSEALS